MFPPLCFVDVSTAVVPNTSREIMRENLSEEEYRFISEEDIDIRVTLRVVELVQNMWAR